MDFTDPSLIPGTTSVEGNFDVVICKGVINGQTDPRSAVKHVTSFVKPGGMLLLTAVSPWGILDQELRHLYRAAIIFITQDFHKKVQLASSIFASHLDFLPTTKPINDWVQDAILHPLNSQYIFSSSDVIDALGNKFTVAGSSPR